MFFQTAAQFKAVYIRHHNVEQDHVWPVLAHRVQRACGILRDQHIEIGLSQTGAQNVQNGRLVVDDQNQTLVRLIILDLCSCSHKSGHSSVCLIAELAVLASIDTVDA